MKEEMLEGRVLRAEAGLYRAKTSGGTVLCTIRGRLKKDDLAVVDPVAVGDRVMISPAEKGKGVIEKILPRKTKLARCDSMHGHREQIIAANVDRLIAVQSCKNPRFNLRALDRYLAIAEAGGLEPVVCVNKIDLDRDGSYREKTETYKKLGYRILFVSALKGEGIDEFRNVLEDGISMLIGPSGAGKSTLLNAVEPALRLKVGDVGKSTRKGRHTTTWVEMIKLEVGGYVVDTPGLREIGLYGIDKTDLACLFPEMEASVNDCKFQDCLHNTEPGCAIKEKKEKGEISGERYESYLRILDSL